jgi:Arc/MetJ-type ribon-helix-helix transcriptional regulator
MQSGIVESMSTQIAVRLPEEMVAFLDRAVAEGKASSRAALVSSALEREMRRLVAEQDAAILAEVGAEDELDTLVDWSVGQLDLDS